MFTQVGVKQLTDFLRTVTAASDLVDCTLVNCGYYDFVSSSMFCDVTIRDSFMHPSFVSPVPPGLGDSGAFNFAIFKAALWGQICGQIHA